MRLFKFQDYVFTRFSKSAHVYRQILATFAASLMSVSGGIGMGQTAVLLPQLQIDENYPYDKTFDSWIASIFPLAMMVGSLLSGSICDSFGRKMSQMVISVPFMIGWISMGFSTSNALILISRFIIGLCTGAARPNSIVFIAELTDPRYRCIALVIPSLAIHVGNLISHIVGTYVYWKTSCFLFAIPNVMTLLILIFLKESPLWLLTEGKIDEGKESFTLYRGSNEHSEKEMTLVLEQNQIRAKERSYKDILFIIFSKPFMKSLLMAFLLFIATHGCGVNVIPFYAEYIFQTAFSGNIDAFSLMIASDCIRIVANIIVCLFTKFCPQRTTFYGSYLMTCLMLVAIAVYLYLYPVGLLWIPVIFFVAYVAAGTALTSISWSIVAEIFPSKVRGLGSSLSSAISFMLLFVCVKITPGIIKDFGEITLYGSYAIATFVAGICLIYIIPETSGRTLQDIESSLYKSKQQVKSNADVRTTYL